MTTPKEQANKNNKPKVLKKIDLPSGAKAELLAFKGRDVKSAGRLADGDQSQALFALIAVATLIDGKTIVMEDLDEMDGRDVMSLMAEYQGLF